MLVRLLRCHFEEERLRTKPAVLHQKRALTATPRRPSVETVSIGYSQNSAALAAQQRP